MARLVSYDDFAAWIDQRTKEISKRKYGRNRSSLLQGIEEQKQSAKEIAELESKLTPVINRTYDKEKKKRLLDSYETLKATVEKKLHCLDKVLQVATLEENCSRVSRDFDVRSVNLVRSEGQHLMNGDARRGVSPSESVSSTSSLSATSSSSNIPGFVSTNAQDCINGLQDNWDWIVKLVKCVDVHLQNSSDYHQFFHEVQESEPWMLEDFHRFAKVFENQSSKNEKDDVKKIESDLDAIYLSLRQWEAKGNRLMAKASKLVPVPLRTDGIQEPTPATSLCDYETKQISFARGEDLLLLDNSDPDSWKVRNGKGEEAFVPPVILLIPGPCKEAIDSAARLQMQLLTTWTNALKRIGVRLLCHMLTIFKPEYSSKEITALASMEDIDKHQLMRLLAHIEDSLRKYWSDHDGFIGLQERLLALRMALEEAGDDEERDADFYKALVVEISALSQLMNIYQDMFKDWEKFKVAVETSRSPELMLIVDKWEQLQYVSREYFSKFWKNKLPLGERERSILRPRDFTIDGASVHDSIDFLSPRPDSARMSVDSVDSLLRPTSKVTRRLNLDDVDDVFSDGRPKTLVTSVVETRTTETVGGNSKHSEHDSRNGRGRSEEKEWSEGGFDETRTKTTTTTTHRVNESWLKQAETGPKQAETGLKRAETGKNVTDGPSSLESGFEETTTRTTTTTIPGASLRRSAERTTAGSGVEQVEEIVNESGFSETRSRSVITGGSGALKRGVETENRRVEMEQLVDATVEDDGLGELRTRQTRSVITDGVQYAKANVVTNGGLSEGPGAKRASPARTIRRLDRTQLSEMEESGFEVLEEIDNDQHQNTPRTRLSSSDYEGTRFGIASETKTAETEQLSSAEMEENKTFVIKSVINPTDSTEISLQQAILQGIIRPTEGTYLNGVKGEAVPIATAMTDGLIKVMFSTTKRSPEKFSSIGIITVKTIRKMARPCVITSVTDTVTKEELSQEEALRRGILDEEQGVYTDRLTGRKLMIAEAVERGQLVVEFCGDDPEPEVISKTYAVRAVVDRRMKRTVTFHEAVRRGIIDKESGAFRDTMTNEKMYVGDAIMRGFLKARVIDDAQSLNIDPENKMVVDKTQKIRERLLKPLKVISAFKMAAKDGAKK